MIRVKFVERESFRNTSGVVKIRGVNMCQRNKDKNWLRKPRAW